MTELKNRGYTGAAANDHRIFKAQDRLKALKASKLLDRQGRWEGVTCEVTDLIEHLFAEVEELGNAILFDDVPVALAEAADVSNMADILTVVIMERENEK